ncbi:MAG: hypothetical protein E7214_03470 [Clostridium sp.]|nr:hypothetical protein [Clostridium sp.]
MKTKDLTFGGIMVAVSVIILYLTTIIPINTLTLLTLASFIIPLCIIRSNIKTSIAVYICTSLISFFIIPINYSLLYICFFGIYGLIKCLIERLNNFKLEIFLKFIFFNFVLIIMLLIASSIITSQFENVSIWLVIIISQLVFGVFDYALTLIISIYVKKFSNR